MWLQHLRQPHRPNLVLLLPAFVHLLDPTYIIPSRKVLRKMVEAKYKATNGKVIALVSTAVSLTDNMWTSINMDAYLPVTCHFITVEGHTPLRRCHGRNLK